MTSPTSTDLGVPPQILVTGFGPFGKCDYNPTEHALKTLASLPSVTTALLPVEFAAATTRLSSLIASTQPDAVISLGLAEPRSALTVERVAINLAEARIPDNAGYQPQDAALVGDGPTAYFSDLPVKAMVKAVKDAGVEAALSYSAGSFVCNAVMYTALHATAGTDALAGFIHVPQATGHETEETTGTAMPQADIDKGIVAAVDALYHPPVQAAGNFGALD